MLEPGSFNTCKNATAPIIAMLDCSGLDTEVPDIGMKTAESNKYREVSGDDGNASSILAIIQEKAR